MKKHATKYTLNLTNIRGVSPLTFTDEPFIRTEISHQHVRYRLSWLYILRCSRNDDGSLGFKFVQDDIIAIIGTRKDCIYVTPLTKADNAIVLRNLCRRLYEAAHCPVIVRKAEFIYQDDLPFLPGRDREVPLEDDTQPETILDFHKLFTPDNQLVQQAVRWRRKITAFESRVGTYKIVKSLAKVSQAQLNTFFASPLTSYKRTSYAEMLRYIRATNDHRCHCMIFLEGKTIKGLYLYEYLGLGRAGLYSGVTARDEQGATEWMDFIAFQDMYKHGINQLLLGGAENEGVDGYIDKLLAQKPRYYANSFVYDHVADIDSDMAIRLARPSDFKALSKLYADFYNNLDNLGERWTLEAARKFISHFYSRQSDLFFIAEKDGNIIGFIVAAIQPWWDGNRLVEGELVVNEKFQQYSLCTTQLLQALLHMAESQYQAITWDTFMPVAKGHPFNNYSQLGFEPIPSGHAVTGDIRSILGQLQTPGIKSR